MDDIGNLESKISKELGQLFKKRKKMDERVVMEVKLEGSLSERHSPPSDNWSWRKYGQKPIKGSPYPRGYYRCSTSKGCSAKKQVERCRTDGSVLIVTYTSDHNHPGPTRHSSSTNQNQRLITQQPHSTTQQDREHELQEKQEPELIIMDHQQMNSTSTSFRAEKKEELENRPYEYDYEDQPVSNSDPSTNLSASKSEDDDFFDELEELPVSSFLTDFTTLFDERILVNLS